VRYFETRFLEEASIFINELNPKIVNKLLYNIAIAEQSTDPRLFKKLHNDIWEIRVRYALQQVRLLAFWDKTDANNTLVLATHGFIKKVDKVPANEIARALRIREKYFEEKNT
jgi:hypothetical protein